MDLIELFVCYTNLDALRKKLSTRRTNLHELSVTLEAITSQHNLEPDKIELFKSYCINFLKKLNYKLPIDEYDNLRKIAEFFQESPELKLEIQKNSGFVRIAVHGQCSISLKQHHQQQEGRLALAQSLTPILRKKNKKLFLDWIMVNKQQCIDVLFCDLLSWDSFEESFNDAPLLIDCPAEILITLIDFECFELLDEILAYYRAESTTLHQLSGFINLLITSSKISFQELKKHYPVIMHKISSKFCMELLQDMNSYNPFEYYPSLGMQLEMILKQYPELESFFYGELISRIEFFLQGPSQDFVLHETNLLLSKINAYKMNIQSTRDAVLLESVVHELSLKDMLMSLPSKEILQRFRAKTPQASWFKLFFGS